MIHDSSPYNADSLSLMAYSSDEHAFISCQFIKLAGESVGISNLSDEVTRSISVSLSFKLINILNDAKKFCIMSRRTKLLGSDIDNALAIKGYDIMNMKNAVYDIARIARLKQGGRNSSDIYYYIDNEREADKAIDITKVIVKQPLLDVGLRAHWLAISGVQPSLAENPMANQEHQIPPPPKVGVNNVLKHYASIQQSGASNFYKHAKPETLFTFHIQVYYKELTEICIGTEEKKREEERRNQEKSTEEKRKEALAALQRDPSVKYLIVPLCSFIYQGIRINIATKNLAILIYIMRMVGAIINNGAIHSDLLEHHLQEIIPSIMSCILSPELCLMPFEENHWALRTYSAKLLCNLCNNYESSILHLRVNIIEILKTFFKTTFDTIKIDPDSLEMTSNNIPFDVKSFTYGPHYGAFYAFSMMGADMIKVHLIPFLMSESLLFEAVKKKLLEINDKSFKADMTKTETYIAQILLLITKRENLRTLDSLQTYLGRYFGKMVFDQLDDISKSS